MGSSGAGGAEFLYGLLEVLSGGAGPGIMPVAAGFAVPGLRRCGEQSFGAGLSLMTGPWLAGFMAQFRASGLAVGSVTPIWRVFGGSSLFRHGNGQAR